MRWPLRNQILLPFAIVMVLAIAVVSGVNAVMAARRTEVQILQQLQNIADVIRPASFPLTDAVLAQARALSGAELIVANAAGKVRASSLPIRDSAPKLATLANTKSDDHQLGASIEFAGERYFHRSLETSPRSSDGEPLRLHILYPERVWRENRRQAAVPPLVVGGLALIVLIAASFLLAQRLSQPLQQLQWQVERIAEGNFEPLALPERNDELRDLVVSVNAMAGNLQTLTQSLRRTERLALLGQLGGGFAHHLRNDITGVKMAVQLHQRQCQDQDRQSLEVALRQLVLTEEHLQQFLAVGKPREPKLVPCDLRTLLDQLFQLVEPMARHRKIALQRIESPELQPLKADFDQLRQLLLNLAINAIDAAGTNGWVKLEAQFLDEKKNAAGKVVRILVSDSGPGPPPEIQHRLFEPFVTGKPEGIGLGLAAVKQIAETHGGTVQLLATSPTCFEVILPVPS